MTVYRHGAYARQLPTALIPPRRVETALPIVIGTAPVHMVKEGYTGPINQPVLAYSYQEAVTTLGYSEEWADYTLCEFMFSQFVLFGMAPVVFINVFDPATHKTNIAAEEKAFVDDVLYLAHTGLVADPTVKNQAGDVTYVKGTDYTVNLIAGRINRVESGAITAGATVQVAYDYGDPSKVDADDIVGGIDGATGAKSGLELIDDVFPRFRLVPGLVLAPGWSHNPLVGAILATKAANINGIFRCSALLDIPSDASGCTKYSDVAEWKNTNNYIGELIANCWPKMRLEDDIFWQSTQLAGLIASVDADNGDIPYVSPSNHLFKMNGACLANGDEVFLGHGEANYLNSLGVITSLNFIGGWRCWGNRTGAYPSNTDVKDSFLPIQRMFNWIGNTLVLTWWQRVDWPINKRLVETIVDSVNDWLNGLAARQCILGGRIVLLEEENPTTDLMDGILRFHLYVTPPSPAREIEFLLEYDPAYLSNLFK